jgi:ABC-type amino acid transport system permease subunit
MVNLLISVLLSGTAVTFAIEFFALVLAWFFDKERLYAVLSLPLSFGALFCFSKLNKTYVVAVPATAFIALILNKVINKPVVLNANRRNLARF